MEQEYRVKIVHSIAQPLQQEGLAVVDVAVAAVAVASMQVEVQEALGVRIMLGEPEAVAAVAGSLGGPVEMVEQVQAVYLTEVKEDMDMAREVEVHPIIQVLEIRAAAVAVVA